MALQIYYNTGDDAQEWFQSTSVRLCQTFTTVDVITVSDIKFHVELYENNSFKIAIYRVDGDHKPTGSAIVSETHNTEGAGWGTRRWETHTFSSPPTLDAATEYALVIYKNTVANTAFWRYDSSSSTYTDGQRGKSTNSGSSWTMDETATDYMFEIWGTLPLPDKPANPAPGHEEADVELTTTPISYDASTPEPADTYNIYFGIKGSALTKIADTKDVLEWRVPYVILNIKDYNPATGSGYRSPVAGDVIYDGTDSYTIAFVVAGDLIGVQYQAKLYAFRTIGPGGKSVGDILTNGVAPNVENPQAVSVTLNDQWHFYGEVEEIWLPPNTTFQWRVDATNENGTTTGDTWEFTTAESLKIQTSYRLIDGGSGPYDYPPGTQGTDWEWTGENCVIAIKRLVAAANNKIWYESI